MLPDFDRADRIGDFWSYPQSRTFAELLIDCEEDRTLRAALGQSELGGTGLLRPFFSSMTAPPFRGPQIALVPSAHTMPQDHLAT
jgi:hypothetical protein